MDNIFFLKTNLKYIFLFLTMIFIAIILLVSSKNINAMNSRIYLYAFTAIFPLLGCFLYILQKRSLVSNPINIRVAIGIITTFIIICILTYLYTLLNAVGLLFVGYIINILVFLLVIVGLAIVYRNLTDYLLKLGGFSRFIVLIIFYLPCLFISIIKYVSNELRITPRISYILLIIELLLLILYYYVSKIVKKDIILHGGELILKEKYFLDTKKTLVIGQNDKETNENNSQINLRTKFCISLWVYLNTPEFNLTNFPIFCYGSDKNPKPKITYGYDNESNQYVFTIYFSTLYKVIKLILPIQRWNNFVFNYDGSMVDLFINGNLERSYNLNNDMPLYDISDNFTIGSDKKGMYGAISKIMYYNRNLTSFEIISLYRLGITTIDL